MFLRIFPILFVFASICLATPNHEGGPSPSSPAKAIEELRVGNLRYIHGKPIHPKDHLTKREKLTAGQKPFAIVFSCSDSRVPPELIFDQGLGDLFIIRVVGHALDPLSQASIEFGVAKLGAQLIVILGHESCGAVAAALGNQSTGSSHLDQILQGIRPNLTAFMDKPVEDPRIHEPVKAHVLGTARQLMDKSQIVRDKVKTGQLGIALGVYNLATGRVEFLK